MEIALALKICGGLIAGLANRFIVRAARNESFAWGICAMFLPGASMVFAVRYRGSLGRPLCAQICGFALLIAAFGIRTTTGYSQGIVEHFRETREAPKRAMKAAEAHAVEADAVTEEKPAVKADTTADLKTRYLQLEASRAKLKTPAEIAAFNTAAAKYQADLKHAREQASEAPDEQRVLVEAGRYAKTAKEIASTPAMWEDLATWYRELERTRKNLNPNDAKAVKTFNQDAARYAAILRERQKQATKLTVNGGIVPPQKAR